MKLQFIQGGKQFFFVTIALAGRPEALSKIVTGQARPSLTPYGAIVKAVFAAVHGEFPAATLSDFVIMPDHVHFLLIVDYEVAPRFNPLWVSHVLMDAVEAAWYRMDGGAAPEPLDMAALLAEARSQAHQRAAAIEGGGSGAAAPVRSTLRFDRHCYIELSFDARQLKAIRHYIRCNPARWLWKRNHPDRFIRHANVRHPVLDPARAWDAMGDLTLLGSPFLFHVRLTLKKSVAEHEENIRDIVEKAKGGMIPVSGFISSGEKEVLRRLKVLPQTRFVKLLPYALPPRYDPSAEDSRELAANRLLILSGFPQSMVQSRNDPAFRANCLAMNDLAAALCATAEARG